MAIQPPPSSGLRMTENTRPSGALTIVLDVLLSRMSFKSSIVYFSGSPKARRLLSGVEAIRRARSPDDNIGRETVHFDVALVKEN